MKQKVKTMCMGEMVARSWHGLRVNPDGYPVSHIVKQAKQHGLLPGEVISKILGDGRCSIEKRGCGRWLIRGPRWPG